MFRVIIDKFGTEVSFDTKREAEDYIKEHNRKIVDTMFQLDLCRNCPIIVGDRITYNRSIVSFLKRRCAFVDLTVNGSYYIKCKNYLEGEMDLIPIKQIETECEQYGDETFKI